jgi:ArsR family transcriptional regulator, cadmium/lead-responsive transcriptional repressor
MKPRRGDEEELWAAVGEPSRRRLLDVLLARGEATPSALAKEVPFTRQAVTKHLAVLDRAGLVEARRQGREVRYVVRPERLDAATRAMARVAAQWDQRLQAIKHLAETAHREEQRNPKRTETDA